MTESAGFREILRFAARFMAIALILVPLWWIAAVPAYGWLLVQGCGVVLRDVLGLPITAGRIELAGILNTESLLIIYVGDHPTSMKFVQLITNVPPFVALILATAGMSLRQRLMALGAGITLLGLGHALFILLALRFSTRLQESPDLPTALTQFFLTLPFLLWIVLAWWKRGDSPAQ